MIRSRFVLVGGLALAGLLVLFGHRALGQRLEPDARAAVPAPPRVTVMTTMRADPARPLALPGTLVAFQEAPLYARATGYVRRWRVDIGDRVRTGDVLAELDTPELEQQLVQARATATLKRAAVEQAAANLDYAQKTAGRTEALFHEGLASQQTLDQDQAAAKVAQATLGVANADRAGADAAVGQLSILFGFANVTAPFDGRVTQRDVNVGSLVIAGGAAGAVPLFHVEATDPMRVFVHVPQAYAASTAEGHDATLSVRQLPGRTFRGKVARTSHAYDAQSRTLNVEVDLPNPDGALVSGMFGQVSLTAAVAHPVVQLPASAVITDAKGTHVAVVGQGDVIRLTTVSLGVDRGAEIDVVDGLVEGQRVVVDPGADLVEGMRVTVS